MASAVLHYHSSPLGETLPSSPRDLFGRDKLVDDIVGLARNLESIALVGPVGIGKTSIALTLLHDRRIKRRFGENRRFIPCDKLPASYTGFLAQLSNILGAGVKNPQSLKALLPFLSSKKMLIVLDNAESILYLNEEISSAVEELCQLETISLCITSFIMIVPWSCKRLEIPPLSMEAACKVFYTMYGNDAQSAIVEDLVKCLDFHALSITLLAINAREQGWDHNQLKQEWKTKNVQILQSRHHQSLECSIQPMLTTPPSHVFGPDVRGLLGVLAFCPQGITSKNLKKLFPDIKNIEGIFNAFRLWSLVYCSDGLFKMLAPFRLLFGPKDLESSPLCCRIRQHLQFTLDHSKIE